MNTEQKPDGLRLKVSGSTAELLRSSFFPTLRFAVLWQAIPRFAGSLRRRALRGPTLNLRRLFGPTVLKATVSASWMTLTIHPSKRILRAGVPHGYAPLSAWSTWPPRQKDLKNIIPAWSPPMVCASASLKNFRNKNLLLPFGRAQKITQKHGWTPAAKEH